MRKSAIARGCLFAISISYVLTGGAAYAQSPDAVTEIDVITVYGDRSAASLEDSTASVGIATDEAIENFHLGELDDAFRVMGNVTRHGSPTSGGFIIRGVNSEGFTPGGAPLATLYIDGVQQTTEASRMGARGVWDVEQVEVYRGPQSTLQGRAALAGAIYLKTKDPTHDLEAKASTEYGTNNHYWGGVTVNLPILQDQVALRLSTEYETTETDLHYPLYEGATKFDEYSKDEYYQIRGKLLVEPRALPNTRAVASYSFSHESPTANLIGGPTSVNASQGVIPGAPINSFDEDRGDIGSPLLQYVENRNAIQHNAGLELTHDASDFLRLTSLTTFSNNVTDRGSINEGTPFDELSYLIGIGNYLGSGSCDGVLFGGDVSCFEDASLSGEFDTQIFVQELRANYDNGPLRTVLGLYFSRELTDGYSHYNGDLSNLFAVGAPEEVSSDGTSSTLNVAGFGEINYEAIPSWRIIAGGRVDYTNRTTNNGLYRRNLQTNGEITSFFSTKHTETVFLPKLGLVKEFGEDHSLGFVYQQGFRGGGAGLSRISGAAYSFDPEFTDNYELSYKGRFVDGRFRVGANAFYQSWKDQQIEIDLNPPNVDTIIDNAAKSSSYGFEIEGTWLATEALSLFTSVGFVETEIEEYVAPAGDDFSGYVFPRAPRWNIAFGGAYKDPSGFFAAASADFSSSVLSSLALDADRTDSHTVVNAQVGFELENFSIAAYAENAFDERFYYSVNDTTSASLGERAQYGIRLGAKY